jgi:hypothetical protein
MFVAVAHTRNFTRAAEQLHLAQQAVSKSVSQLERELGVTASMTDLSAMDAVAIVATGAATDAESTTVALRGDVTLPLLAVHPPGRPSPTVARLIALASRPWRP